MAEREGFEPPVPVTQNNGFRDRPVRPLRHLSNSNSGKEDHCLPFCGERGIRTPGTLTSTTVFKTAAFNRSAISPDVGRKSSVFFYSAKILMPIIKKKSQFFDKFR